MFDNYKPSTKERKEIEAGFRFVLENCRSEYEAVTQVKAEHRGYGNTNDRVPLIAAKALIVQWFRHGAAEPDALLRKTYHMRPAAIWAQGVGCCVGHEGKFSAEMQDAMNLAVAAHNAAFERMQAATMAN